MVCICINYIFSRPPWNGDNNSYYLLPGLLQYPPLWSSYFYFCTLKRYSSHSSQAIFLICKLGHVPLPFPILWWLYIALKIKPKFHIRVPHVPRSYGSDLGSSPSTTNSLHSSHMAFSLGSSKIFLVPGHAHLLLPDVVHGSGLCSYTSSRERPSLTTLPKAVFNSLFMLPNFNVLIVLIVFWNVTVKCLLTCLFSVFRHYNAGAVRAVALTVFPSIAPDTAVDEQLSKWLTIPTGTGPHHGLESSHLRIAP